MTGREGAAPKLRAATPGWPSSVAPSDDSRRLSRSCPAQHGSGLERLELPARPRGDRYDVLEVQLGIDRHYGRGAALRSNDLGASGGVPLG